MAKKTDGPTYKIVDMGDGQLEIKDFRLTEGASGRQVNVLHNTRQDTISGLEQEVAIFQGKLDQAKIILAEAKKVKPKKVKK